MRGVVAQTLIYLGAIVPVASFAAGAESREIKALRVWPGPESTRAVFDVSGPLDYKLFELANPDRIVLDIRDARFIEGFEVPSVKGALKTVRVGKQGKADLRVVFDLAQGVRPKSFLLPPADKFGYRLVVDLYPDTKAPVKQVVKSAEEVMIDGARKIVVAIDAGHGGEDPGATGATGTFEKSITLSVAKELATLVDAQAGMKAVLTRNGDYFIPLADRYRKAREAKADLFVSIHADAFTRADAKGSSVWVLSPRGATSEAARWLADRENGADLVGGVSLDDKDDTLAAVLLDLSQGATMEASNAVAQNVLRALAKLGPTHRNYIEKANFVVLRSPDVPSILVETAFISNPAEEKRLNDALHREKLAGAILDGVKTYFSVTPPPGTWYAANRLKTHVASEHVVGRGETLSGIAASYGMNLSALRAANKLADDSVRAGDVLQIPPG